MNMQKLKPVSPTLPLAELRYALWHAESWRRRNPRQLEAFIHTLSLFESNQSYQRSKVAGSGYVPSIFWLFLSLFCRFLHIHPVHQLCSTFSMSFHLPQGCNGQITSTFISCFVRVAKCFTFRPLPLHGACLCLPSSVLNSRTTEKWSALGCFISAHLSY